MKPIRNGEEGVPSVHKKDTMGLFLSGNLSEEQVACMCVLDFLPKPQAAPYLR